MSTEGAAAVMDPEASPPSQPDGGAAQDVATPVAARRVLPIGVPEPSLRRLADVAGIELMAADAGPAGAELVLISTRNSRDESLELLGSISTSDTPVVVLVHAGGESTSVELLRAGAATVVAEGNEDGVAAVLEQAEPSEALVEALIGRDRDVPAAGPRQGTIDPVTRLRGPEVFEARLQRAHAAPPRLGFLRIVGMTDGQRLSIDGTDLLRRRLAQQIDEECRQSGAETYSIEGGDFAIVSEELSLREFEALGARLSDIVASFAPDRSAPLRLAMGHAGPEASAELDLLQDLARRGLQLGAAPGAGDHIVGAAQLAKAVASSLELDAAMNIRSAVEGRDPSGAGHGDRVGRYAVSVAQELGFEGRALTRIRLAGALHHVGKIGFSDELFAVDPDALDDSMAEAYRSHATIGADMLRVSAGRAVAEMVASHHEHWDGSGHPDGKAQTEIPIGARIIAAVDALDRWTGGPPRPSAEALARLGEGAGTTFDPSVVEACRRVFGGES